MTGTKGHSGGKRPGQGRPKRENASRHNILIDDDIWDWLKSKGDASETIEKLVREKMDAKYETQMGE
jgi:hypothetical protein